MKSKVRLSYFCLILTFVINIALIYGCYVTFNERITFLTLLFLLLLLITTALLYGPVSIVSDDKYVTVQSVLKKHRLRMDEIVSAEPMQPTMGERRLFGSGGYMGYWGIFRDGELGKYTAYYGRGSDCFLIRLKNGDKYLLGCDSPKEMTDFISERISKKG